MSKNITNFIKYTSQYAIAPFIPLVGNHVYFKLLWEDEHLSYPYFFTQEQTLLAKRLYKSLRKTLCKSTNLTTWGHRYIKDFYGLEEAT